jgi:hypothetical protein
MRASTPGNPPINSYEEKYFILDKLSMKNFSCAETAIPAIATGQG